MRGNSVHLRFGFVLIAADDPRRLQIEFLQIAPRRNIRRIQLPPRRSNSFFTFRATKKLCSRSALPP